MAKVYGDEEGFKERYAKLKGEPLKVRLGYLWGYYGKIAIGIIAGIALIIVLIITFVRNSRPYIVNGLCCSSMLEDGVSDRLKTFLAEKLEENEDDYQIDYNYSLYSDENDYSLSMKIYSRVSAEDLDFIVSFRDMFDRYLGAEDEESEIFGDLRELLPEDLFEALDDAGRINYVSTDWGEIPYFVYVDDSSLYDLLGLSLTDQYIGLPVNAQNTDAIEVLLWEALN